MAKKSLPVELQTATINRAEHEAIKLLSEGKASDYQQKLALKVIIDKFSRSNELIYIPGSPDGSTFLAGRSFVGKRLLKYMNSPVSESPEVKDNA